MAVNRADEIGEAAEKAFRRLIAEKPYRSITVKDICEQAHLSRKAFYSRFSNKDDIVAGIFRRDAIKPLERINQVFAQNEVKNMGPLVYQKMYQGLYDNRAFYANLVRPWDAGGEIFVQVATDAIYEYNLPIISSLAVVFDDQEIDYIAYYFASSQAMLMMKWINDGMSMPAEKLARLYRRMSEEFWATSSRASR